MNHSRKIKYNLRSSSDSNQLKSTNKRFAERDSGRKVYHSLPQTPGLPVIKICRSTYSLLLGRRQPCRKIAQKKKLELSHRRVDLDSGQSCQKCAQNRMLELALRRAEMDSGGAGKRLLAAKQVSPVVKTLRAPRFAVVPPPEWDSFETVSPDKVDIIDTVDDSRGADVHPEGVTVFRDTAVVTFQEATEIMLCNTEHPHNRICTAVPPSAPLASTEAAFLIDTDSLVNPNDVRVDEHGSWGRYTGKCAYYKKVDSKEKFKKLNRGTSTDFDVRMYKISLKHPATDNQLHKLIFTGQDSSGQPLRWALVSYLWTCKPFFFTPLPHGNSKVNFKPFQPIRASVKEEMKDLLKDQAPSVVMAKLHSTQEYENVSPAEMPRMAQLENMSRNVKKSWSPARKKALIRRGRLARSAMEASRRKIVTRQLAFPKEENYDDGYDYDYDERNDGDYNEDYDYYYGDYEYTAHTVEDRPIHHYSKASVQQASSRYVPTRYDLPAASPYEMNSTENVSYTWTPLVQERSNSFEFIDVATDDAEDYPVGVAVFQSTAVVSFEEAVMIILHSTRHMRSRICTTVPPRAPLKSRQTAFVVDTLALMNARDVLVDEHGSWGRYSTKSEYYKQINSSSVSRMFQKLARRPGQQIDDFDVRMLKWTCRHPATDGNLNKLVFMAEDSNRHPLRWAVVSYLWSCDPFMFTPLPHGNSRKNVQPFQPTRASTKQQMKNLLKHQVPSNALNNFHSTRAFESPSQAEMPRDMNQMYNFSRKVKGPRKKWQKRWPDRRKEKSSSRRNGETCARTDGIYPGGSDSKHVHQGRAKFSHGAEQNELERAVEGIASSEDDSNSNTSF